jgi:hypothetical protein
MFRKIQVTMHEQAQEKAQLQNPPVKLGACQPKQLLMDMPVRWSSTYVMLHRAYTL